LAAEYIEDIRRLADTFRPNERNLPLYFPDFETPPPADSLNQVFGSPTGITADRWPLYPRLGELLHRAGQLHAWDPGDLRMEHVFTLDLRGVRVPAAPADAAAMMLFISNADAHHAHQNGNVDTSVVFLTQRELEQGPFTGELPRRSVHRWSRRFSLQRVDVPGDVFDPQEDPNSPIAILQDAIWQAPARLGGCPMWVREPTDPRDFVPQLMPARPAITGVRGRESFIMQFEHRFAPINLGNFGVMYVSGIGAYYQDYERMPAVVHEGPTPAP
jgi:hypothetical protein